MDAQFFLRGLLVWGLIILAEIAHGILRARFLLPRVGDWKSRQIGVFTGSLMIFLISLVLVPWLQTQSPLQLLGLGVIWSLLTLAFELLFGHFVARCSWQRILEDYNLPKGGLMPLGLLAMGLSPWLAGMIRGIF